MLMNMIKLDSSENASDAGKKSSPAKLKKIAALDPSEDHSDDDAGEKSSKAKQKKIAVLNSSDNQPDDNVGNKSSPVNAKNVIALDSSESGSDNDVGKKSQAIPLENWRNYIVDDKIAKHKVTKRCKTSILNPQKCKKQQSQFSKMVDNRQCPAKDLHSQYMHI